MVFRQTKNQPLNISQNQQKAVTIYGLKGSFIETSSPIIFYCTIMFAKSQILDSLKNWMNKETSHRYRPWSALLYIWLHRSWKETNILLNVMSGVQALSAIYFFLEASSHLKSLLIFHNIIYIKQSVRHSRFNSQNLSNSKGISLN